MTPIKCILIILAGLALALISGPIFIPMLRKLKFGQTIRDDGPQTHLKKQGTPTIGGLIFLVPALILGIAAIFIFKEKHIAALLIATVGFGLVGFLDDFLKIKKHSKDGLFAWQKMLALIAVAAVYSLYLKLWGPAGADRIAIDFFGKHVSFSIGWFLIPYAVLVMISTTNAVNLTDGLDGLCAGCSVIEFMTLAILAYTLDMDRSITVFSFLMIGTLLGFLFFNYNPAKVFMGDTGSLALGGAMAAIIIMMGKPLLLIISGFLFVMEALSVILQVGFFKLTHGKRIFKMAPLHHHFELCGHKEKSVVYAFWGVSFVCGLLGYFSVVL